MASFLLEDVEDLRCDACNKRYQILMILWILRLDFERKQLERTEFTFIILKNVNKRYKWLVCLTTYLMLNKIILFVVELVVFE